MTSTDTDLKDLRIRATRMMADGTLADLGTATQLGWVPPSPRYLVPMLPSTRRARREVRR